MEIHSASDIAQLVNQRGFLPFFASEISDFSLEEVTPLELWFPDDGPDMGVWDYKSDVIMQAGCAYGRFYRGKACFVSLKWYRHLVNYRRACFTLSPTERDILAVLREHRSLLSGELKRLCGYIAPRQPRVTNPLERIARDQLCALTKRHTSPGEKKRHSFDHAITHLQMAGYVLCADFEYKHDRHGKRYGWGMARYCTPEDFFGPEAMAVDCTPLESAQILRDHLVTLLPYANEAQIEHILHQ